MKHFNEISYKYLKSQKKRSMLTVAGIILSVALFTSIGTLINSFRENEIRNVIEAVGSYHFNFKDISGDKVKQVLNHTAFKNTAVVGMEGTGLIHEVSSEEAEKTGELRYKYLNIESYDEKALNILPVTLKEGSLPANKDEIIIQESALKYFPKGIKIGDKLNIKLIKRYNHRGEDITFEDYYDSQESIKVIGERSYTLSGIIKSNVYYSSNAVFKAITLPEAAGVYDSSRKYKVYGNLNNIKNAYTTVREIGKDLNIITTEKDEYKHMNINGALLTLSGQSIYANVNDSLILLVIFLVTLVVISTILVIYNIFQISVMERITQIGILRSIGASPKQIKNMVFKEAFTLSIIGIPLGILSGVTASKILIYILSASSFNSFKGMSMYVNSKVILLSIILGSITVYFSARKPAKIAGRISPLEAVRNTGAIKNEKYKRIRSGRILRRIFGIEGELAYKNIKRNRRRFTVTVASLVISIVLFIVFNSFMNYTMRTNTSNVGMIFDMQIRSNNPFSEEYLKVLSQQPFISKAYKQNINYAPAFIKSDKINTAYLEKSRYREGLMYNLQGENIIYFNGSSLYGYHKDFLDMTRNYVTQGEINEEEMNRVNGVVLVHDPRIYDPLERQVHNINLTNLQVGDEVILDLNGKMMESFNKDNKFPEIKPNNKFKIVAIAEQVPVTINKEDPINFITTEKVYANAMETDKFKHINIILNKDVKRDEAAASIKKLSPVDSDIVIEDFYERVKRQKQSKLIMSVFLYGFVSIIVLIGSLNILNTINTNLLLRKREFASLKAIGMSQRQVKKQIWIEGVLYGVIAAFWGSIIGGILSYLMYRIFNMMTSFDYSIPWMGMLIGSIGTIVITLLSSYPPLKRINNSNIIEAIKMEE